MKLTLIRPLCPDRAKTRRLQDVLDFGLEGYDYDVLETIEQIEAADLRGRRLLFAIELGESGINLEYVRLLKSIRMNRHMFDGCLAGIVVDGDSELFTKSVSRHLVFSANRAGCAFPGRPLVEGTRTLQNFNIIAANMNTDNSEAYRMTVRQLVEQITDFQKMVRPRPKLLVIHSGSPDTSNTLILWDMIKEHLDAEITEISLREGQLHDCNACDYETCLHFGEKSRCFYGGVITREVYPAILDCDALVMLCPNYNDAVSANLTAFINRLTALFRVRRFYDKSLYAVVVSGYSGGDIVAEQLISALNMNKSFYLPPRFVMMKTANDPGAIASQCHVKEDAADFAARIMEDLAGCAAAPDASAASEVHL